MKTNENYPIIKNMGMPKNIGELKDFIKDYPDEIIFGFRNQPIQELKYLEYENGNSYLVFDELPPIKKIYLAGKVTGLSRIEVSQKFGKVEKQLMDEGYAVVNPLNIVDPHDTWLNAMKICIKALLDCDEAYFMPCWIDSAGARIEHGICNDLAIPFRQDTGKSIVKYFMPST